VHTSTIVHIYTYIFIDILIKIYAYTDPTAVRRPRRCRQFVGAAAADFVDRRAAAADNLSICQRAAHTIVAA